MVSKAKQVGVGAMSESREALERHNAFFVYFFDDEVPVLLREVLASRRAGWRIVDVGCGDGTLVWALKRAGLLRPDDRVEGVDLSRVRVENFRRYTGYPARTYDGGRLPWPSGSVDLVMTTQVLEHVEDESAFLRELCRLVKPRGRVFLSTVMKRPWAWYFYRNPYGRWVLEPTHLREYNSLEELELVFRRNGLEPLNHRTTAVTFSPFNTWLRVWYRLFKPKNFLESVRMTPWLRWAQRFRVRIPGYFYVDFILRTAVIRRRGF